MQYIHYHNDFTVPISLVGDSITIDPEMINSVTFYTRKQGNRYCCCWDCKTLYKDEEYVCAVLNGHDLEPGVLKYIVEYQIPDTNYPDGFQKICQHYTSDIELTTQNGDITVAEAQIIYGDTIEELLESAGYSYTKDEVDEMIAQLDLDINTYSKDEIDQMIADVDAYTKSETNTLLSGKADRNSVYTKTESDNKYLTAQDISQLANRSEIPTKTSQLQNDSSFVSDARYVHTDNNYSTTEKNKLSGIASGAEVNVQADWNVTNTSSDAYIKNKPTIPIVSSSLTGSSQTDAVQGGTIYTALQGKANYKEYGTYSAMTADDPANGTIVFEGDNENFYIYDRGNGIWKPIDKSGGAQSNWNETDNTSPAYIQNKPTIPDSTSDLTNDSNFIADAGYVHTDNNYTTAEKTKLAGLDGKQKTVLILKGQGTGAYFVDENGTTLTTAQVFEIFASDSKEPVVVQNDYYHNMSYKEIDEEEEYAECTFSCLDFTGVSSRVSTVDVTIEDGSIFTTVDTKAMPASDNVGFGQGYGTQSNSSQSSTITVTMSNYKLVEGGIVVVYFKYDVPANATMNIASKGAKQIYFRNARIVADTIKAGDTATFIYSGSYYRLISNDRWGTT